ncbi:MAG: nitroreductase family protein [Candidatus Aenigmatarchaeota archaeon]
MDVIDAIRERRSIRAYTGEAIEQEDLEQMLDAARRAPSAKNLQPWKFVVVIDPYVLEDLVPACRNQAFVKDAGAFIVGLIEDKKWAEIDLAIALDHLSLEAVELGYGSCWIGAFKEEALREKLDIPEDHQIKVCMTIGVPGESPRPPTKKTMDELVDWVEIE